jgi:hypothetical protein
VFPSRTPPLLTNAGFFHNGHETHWFPRRNYARIVDPTSGFIYQHDIHRNTILLQYHQTPSSPTQLPAGNHLFEKFSLLGGGIPAIEK